MFRLSSPTLILFSLCIVFSCNKDEADTRSPQVALQILQSGVPADLTIPLRGMVTLKGYADEASVFTAYIDGDMIAQQASAQEISAEFDTRQLAEGLHYFKVEAIDANQNSSEIKVAFATKNIMFSYSYSAGAFGTDPPWMLVSDGAGNVFDFKQMGSSNTAFKYPLDFTAETFDVTFYSSSLADPNNHSFYTVKNVLPGSYGNSTPAPTPPTPAGTFNITVAPADAWSLVVSSPDLLDQTIDQNGTSYSLSLKNDQADIYVWYRNIASNIDKYKMITAVAGQSLSIDQNYIDNEMVDLTEHSLAGSYNSYFSIVLGKWMNTDYYAVCSIDNATQPTFLYPAEEYGHVFSDFVSASSAELEEDGRFVSINTTGPSSDVDGFIQSIDQFNVSLTNVLHQTYPTLKMNFSGTADYLVFNLRNLQPSSETWSWNVQAPYATSVLYNLPELPSAFLQAVNIASVPTIKVSNVSIVDTPVTDHYEDFAASHFGEPLQFSMDNKSKSYSFDPETSGERRRPQKSMNLLDRFFKQQRSQFFPAQ